MRTIDPTKWSKKRLGVTPGGLEDRLRSSLGDAMREYLRESSLEGIKYCFVDTIKPLKYIYGTLMMFILLCGLSLVVYFSYEHRSRPLQMTLTQNPPPITVPFPAVAICSNSIVSQKELRAYATHLYASVRKSQNHHINSTRSLRIIMNNLKKFAALITLSSVDVETLSFMQFLYSVDPDFNITDLMYKLSPKCPSILSSCRWRGRQYACDRLFATRLTPLGFCCLFNSRYEPEDVNSSPKVLDLVGQNYGLTVAVLENIDDFAVVRQPQTYGFSVLVFDGSEYPLIEGGAVRQYIVGTNMSVFFQLSAHVQYITQELRANRDKICRERQTEGPRLSLSSYAWCLSNCRQTITISICNCIPFWYRTPLYLGNSETVCTPEHLNCLNKHREKLMYFYPGVVEDGSLDEEMKNSLECVECRPDCARILHSAKVFQAAYYNTKKLYKNSFSFNNEISLVNKTLLRFFYDSKNHNYYRVDLNSYWYEVFASTSCQALLLAGASLVASLELNFHLTLRWGHHLVRRTRREMARRRRAAFHH